MNTSIEQIARKFSEGAFDDVADHLAPGVLWTMVNGRTLQGKDKILDFCTGCDEETRPDSAPFPISRVISTNNIVVIEGSMGKVYGFEGVFFKSFCDVFRFENNLVTEIRSYCIAVNK